MKWLFLLLLCAANGQERPALASFVRHGNRFLLQLREGAAEVEWASSSTFRLRRTFGPALPARSGPDAEPVAVTVNETPGEISFLTTYLTMTMRKDDLRIRVQKADGTLLANDLTPAQRRDGVTTWEWVASPDVRYYGLGARTGAILNLRGILVLDAIPFFFSTAGYGVQFVAAGKYDFDMERLRRGHHRLEIRHTDLIDYYFLFGPTPKEIFEERVKVVSAPPVSPAERGGLQWMIERSLSGIVLPPETVMLSLPAELRKRLAAYMGAYVQEAHDRGFPILHPLPFQFPRDAEANKYTDESMFGDEMLVATGAKAYLPQGIWTNLKTNEILKGRQVLGIREKPSVFARNGAIIPLEGQGTLELHYFPKLGAEFFIYEEEAADYTQVHAAPAVDIMRLEIESKVARDYTWIVHHLEGVKGVAVEEAPFAQVKTAGALQDRTWYFDDARQNLYVRARVAAGQDHIVNLSF